MYSFYSLLQVWLPYDVSCVFFHAQVTLVHVNAIAKNAADDKLRQSLRRFANTYPPPATVVLISGDVNFSAELNDLTNCHNLTVVLVHNTQASDALKVFASRLVNYDHFIADVQPPSQPQVCVCVCVFISVCTVCRRYVSQPLRRCLLCVMYFIW